MGQDEREDIVSIDSAATRDVASHRRPRGCCSPQTDGTFAVSGTRPWTKVTTVWHLARVVDSSSEKELELLEVRLKQSPGHSMIPTCSIHSRRCRIRSRLVRRSQPTQPTSDLSQGYKKKRPRQSLSTSEGICTFR